MGTFFDEDFYQRRLCDIEEGARCEVEREHFSGLQIKIPSILGQCFVNRGPFLKISGMKAMKSVNKFMKGHDMSRYARPARLAFLGFRRGARYCPV